MLSSEVVEYNKRLARLRTGDTLLTTNTETAKRANEARVSALSPGESALGRTWGYPEADSVGVNLVSGIRTALGGMSNTDAQAVARAIRDAMAPYCNAEASSSLEVDPAGVLVTGGGTEPSAVTADVARRTGDAHLRHLDAPMRTGMGRLGAMNAAAKSFWSGQPRP